MTSREIKIERAQQDVLRQESRVREASMNLTHGYAKAKADFEREYAKLKEELIREKTNLEVEKLRLKELEENAVDSFGDVV